MATKLAPRFGSMSRGAKKQWVTEALAKNQEGGSCLCFSKTY